MMVWRQVLIWLVAVSVLGLAACQGADKEPSDVSVELSVAPDPPQVGVAVINVALHDADGQPIRGTKVELEGTMTHAGMVPVFAQALEVAPGRYQADLEFTMGGDWFILIHADLPDGRSMERKVDIPGVDAVCGETPAP
jgi:hypothetical protein